MWFDVIFLITNNWLYKITNLKTKTKVERVTETKWLLKTVTFTYRSEKSNAKLNDQNKAKDRQDDDKKMKSLLSRQKDRIFEWFWQ